MSNLNQLMAYLDRNGVSYQIRADLPAFSARQAALATHMPESQTTKTLVVQAGKQKWMVVLRADQRLDQNNLRQILEAQSIHLVSEEELEALFPNCEIGAMPPFGNLYGFPVLVDKALAEDYEIVFNACTHTESVRMKFRNFVRLVKPTIADVATVNHTHHNETVEETL